MYKMTETPNNDIHRIERGLEKLNDKMDSVHSDLTKIMVQNAQHLTRTDTHAEDIKILKADKEKTDNKINDLEISVSNLKTKVAPILVAVTMFASVIITKVAGVIWPTAQSQTTQQK